MSSRTAAVALGLLLLAAYVLGSGLWVQTNGGWYASLSRPAWQPPDWVFGVVWPYNFVVLGIALVQVPRRLSAQRLWWWIGLFALSVVAALAWSYLFYVPHHLTAAAVSLGCAALLTAPLVAFTWSISRTLGIALLPYQVWLLIATSLSVAYAARS